MRLTETEVSKLPTPPEHKLISDDACTGLYVKCYAKSGRKSFIYRARQGGKWQVVTLGSFPAMSLAQARRKAGELSDRKSSDVAGMTFGQLLDAWYSERVETRYARTVNAETYVARGKAALGSRQLSVLSTVELVAELKRYAKTSPVAANRCLTAWKLAIGYGIECGYLTTDPLARTTARVVGGEEQSRSRVLNDAEISELWSWTHGNAALLRFLLCTGLRLGEGLEGRQDGSVWRVDTTKNGKAHWVHLSPLALAQITDGSVSAITPSGVQRWLREQIKRTGMEPFTAHDLRRTCSTRMAGMAVEPHIVEKILNHTMGGVMGIYNRHEYAEQRIAAANAWSDELSRIVS